MICSMQIFRTALFVTKVANDSLIKLAHRHKVELNVSSELYDLFMHSLLTTLSQFYSKFDNKCALAWRITMVPGIELMKHMPDLEYD